MSEPEDRERIDALKAQFRPIFKAVEELYVLRQHYWPDEIDPVLELDHPCGARITIDLRRPNERTSN